MGNGGRAAFHIRQATRGDCTGSAIVSRVGVEPGMGVEWLVGALRGAEMHDPGARPGLAIGTEFQYTRDRGLMMDFEWDNAKEEANRRKHAVDFPTAARVFLDPYVVEFDDLDAVGELRFCAIGVVDGRALFVSYAMRGAVIRIISARGAEPHEKRKYHEI